MAWRVEIKEKEGVFDALGESIQKDILDLGLKDVKHVRVTSVYTINGPISESQIKTISEDLLTDTITQDYEVSPSDTPHFSANGYDKRIVEIAYNPGVMDPVEESTLKGIRDLGIKSVDTVRTAKQFHLYGELSDKEVALIVDKVLANKLIQHVVPEKEKSRKIKSRAAAKHKVEVRTVDILNAKTGDLKRISQQGQLFLNTEEMRAIQGYFKSIKRNPTDCELETVAQTWSEHCHHKTFRGQIEYSEKLNGKTKTKTINNLLKTTIIKATEKIGKTWCVSVFHDNAGVIKFDKDWNVCFKVETHNHPSALEPFGGANTGIGGVIRDTLGTGLGARPVCNTDVFCFGPPDYPFEKLPAGTLHPKRVMKGVVSGVRDYGNKMGIPTVNGAILFDDRYVGNPLVYCGNVGLIPKGKDKKKPIQGDLVVVAGGRTGRDGIHGATFSSGELTTDSEVVSSGAVQIGDPIQEKKVLDVLMQARDANLYSAITDCGAGGFSSAVGEMGEKLGARVDLEKAPLKYKGLSYTEIWISESQERMVLSVSPQKIEKLLQLFRVENVEATVIGEFTGSRRLELFYHGRQVCDLDMEFLHGGIPRITKKATWAQPKPKKARIPVSKDCTKKLLECLSHYNVCSKEWVIRQYDHEVQGGSVIKPLVGVNCDGPSDAGVVAPLLDSNKGLAVSNGINPRYGMIDPYWMAASCIDEAIRQIVAVGGNVERVALLDNFCWGNPDKPDRLGGLVRCAKGCYDMAVAYQTPFISGKDSLYNEYAQGKKSIAIPGTLLISAIGIIDDVRKCITSDFKQEGNLIYVIGTTFDEMGGSIYFDTYHLLGNDVPKVSPKKTTKLFRALNRATGKGLIASLHDCSDGGLGVALAEMAIGGGFGLKVDLEDVPYKGRAHRDDFILFSESNSRFIAEVRPQDRKKFEKELQGVPFSMIGTVRPDEDFSVKGFEDICIKTTTSELKQAWQKPLDW